MEKLMLGEKVAWTKYTFCKGRNFPASEAGHVLIVCLEKGKKTSAILRGPVHFLRYQATMARGKDLSPLCGSGEPGPEGLEAFRTALPSPASGFHGGCQRTKYTLVNDSHLAREVVKMTNTQIITTDIFFFNGGGINSRNEMKMRSKN